MNKQITGLSDLYKDIWLEIFTYFYVDELFHTFLHISNDVDSILLNNVHLRFHIRINYEISKSIFSKINPIQIVSFSIEEIEENNIDISKMICLRSISVKGTNSDRWMEDILTQMKLLKQIEKLSILLFYNDRGSYLLDLALRISNLKQLNFYDMSVWEKNYHYKQTNNMNENLSIMKLNLNFYCQFQYIQIILSYLKNIRSLRLKLLRGNDSFYENVNKILFNHMKKIHLTLCDVSFDRIISFLKKMPNISTIIIDGNIWGTNSIAYFKIDNWYQILSCFNGDILDEKKIQVDLDLRQDYSNLSRNNIGLINYDDFNRLGLQVTSYTVKGIIKI